MIQYDGQCGCSHPAFAWRYELPPGQRFETDFRLFEHAHTILKALKLHDDEKACWNFLLLTIHIMILLKLMFVRVCYWVLVMDGTHLSSWLQYWDFRPSQVVSRGLLPPAIGLQAWDSMSINPKMGQTMGFWGFFVFFFGSTRFLRSQLKYSCQKLFRQQGARGCPTVFLPSAPKAKIVASMFDAVDKSRRSLQIADPWVYRYCSRVHVNKSILYGILI